MSVQTPVRTNAQRMAAPQTTISKSAAPQAVPETETHLTVEQVKAAIESRLKSSLDQAMAQPRPEEAIPYPWWDILAYGPFNTLGTSPSKIIRAGQPAYFVSVMLLNPFYPYPLSAAQILSNFALPYEITYQTGNLTTWTQGPSDVNTELNSSLVPGQYFYVDVLSFVGQGKDEVLYETNISCRIFGCGENYAPDFAGFAREVVDFDPSIWLPSGPGMVSSPIRWMVYSDIPDEH